jgi:hypothetical protein
MYSAVAEHTRDAIQGEDLVVSPAPHGCSNWLTSSGKSHVAVCIPNKAALAVQQAGSDRVRGANFVHLQNPDKGHYDFLDYIDGNRARVALDRLPRDTKVRVLCLRPSINPDPLPAHTTATEAAAPNQTTDPGELALAGASTAGGGRLLRFARRLSGCD